MLITPPAITSNLLPMPTNEASLLLPINVVCAAAFFPSGREFKPRNLYDEATNGALPASTAGYFVFRQLTAGALTEVLVETIPPLPAIWTVFVSPLELEVLKPMVLYQAKQEPPWTGVLMAGAYTGAFQVADQNTGYPQYHLRAFFRGSDDGQVHSGSSEPSPAFKFTSGSPPISFKIPSGGSDGAVEVSVEDPTRQGAGTLTIRRSTGLPGDPEIEIANAAGTAKLILHSDGTIELKGKKVVIQSSDDQSPNPTRISMDATTITSTENGQGWP